MPHTLLVLGVIQGIIGIVAAQWLRVPPGAGCPRATTPATATTAQTTRSYTPREMLKSPVFWLLFVMMALMSTSA